MSASLFGSNTGYLGAPDEPARRGLLDLQRRVRIGEEDRDATPGDPNGFPDRGDAVVSFDNATRTLTITGTYAFYVNGVRYTKSGDSFQIADTEGPHLVYYGDDGTLVETSTFVDNIIDRWAFVAFIYWDATNGEAIPWEINEQHGSSMSAVTHSYLHNTRGAVYDEGILPAATSVDGNGSLDDHARFSTTAGIIWDEDIEHTILAHGSTDNIPVLYRSGASGDWRMDDDSSFIVRKGTSRAYWNENTGATWQLTEAGNNNYVLAHVFAIPGPNETNGGVVVIMGQAVYSTIVTAREGARTEIADIQLDGLPSLEFVPVATFIVQTATGFSNTVSSAIVSTDTGDEYIDWRNSGSLSGGGGSGADIAALEDRVDDLEALGTWTDFTPSWTNFTLGNGTVNFAKYAYVPGGMKVSLMATLGSTSSVSGLINFDLPNSETFASWATASGAIPLDGQAIYWDINPGLRYVAQPMTNDSLGTVCMRWLDTDADGYVVNQNSTASLPFSWASGDLIQCSVFIPL